ncbi:hypothetical protein N9061_02530 [bacterium]|nr:hypothetical protein [Mariniblastus sp.]MDB4484000.1 hypothetical protein [bacterium]
MSNIRTPVSATKGQQVSHGSHVGYELWLTAKKQGLEVTFEVT